MRFSFIFLVFGTFLLKNVACQAPPPPPFMLGNVLAKGNTSIQDFFLQQSSSDMNKLFAQNISQIVANRLISIVSAVNDLFVQYDFMNKLMSMDLDSLNMTLYNMTGSNGTWFTMPTPMMNMTMPPAPSPSPPFNVTMLSLLMNMFNFTMGNMSFGSLAMLNLTNDTIGRLNDLRGFVFSTVNKITKFQNITDVVKFMNGLNDTLFSRLQSLPPMLQPFILQFQFNDLDPNMIIDGPIMEMINLNSYTPNITDTITFWNNFSQRSPPLIGFFNDTNATDSDMIGFMSLFQVPQSDNAKNNFMSILNQTLMMNSTNFKTLVSAVQTNGTINSSVIMAIQPVLGSLSCQILKKVDFNDMKVSVFDLNMTVNVQGFQKLVACNPVFMNDALTHCLMAPPSLDPILRTALVSTYIDYLNLLPLGNYFDLIATLGPLMRDIPSGRINDILSKFDMNQTIQLIQSVNLTDMYPTLPADVKTMFAKYSATYFMSIANTSWSSNDIMLFNTTFFDIPTSQLQNILMMNATFKKVFTVLDTITPDTWCAKCDAALSYYSFLLKTLKQTNDTTITLDRLKPMLMCKRDCDFSDLQPRYANGTYFARTIILALKPEIAPMCRSTVGRLLRPDNMSNITDSYLQSLAPIPLSAVFSANELVNLNPASVVSSLVNTTVDKSVAQKFRDITANKSIADAGSLIVGQSLDYFLNKSASEVKSSIDTITKYIPQLSSPIKLDLIKKCLKNSTKSDFLSFSNSIDPDTAKLVPLSKCKDANITIDDLLNNPYVVLSDACRKYVAKNVMQNKTLSSFDATTVANLAAIISALPPSAFQNLSLDTAIALISGPQQGNVDASIRRNVYNAIKNAAMTTIGPLPSQYLAVFTDSIVKQLGGDIFMELSEDELKVFSKMPVFMSVINLVSQIPRNKCCSFVRTARQRFAMYAIDAMGKTGMTLTSADLDVLGPFLVSSFSVSLIGQIDLQSLSDRISYFQGFCFQLNKADSAAFGQILKNLTTLPMYASNNDQLMLNLGDLVYFYPDFTSVNWTSFDTVQNNVKAVKVVRSNMAITIVQCRSEFNKIDSYDMNDRVKKLDNLVLTLFQQRKASGYTMRKRRQTISTSTYTCSDIRTLGDSVGQWNSSQLALIQPPSEFLNCLIDLGSATKNWSTSSLVALAGLYKNYANVNASSITDTVIGQLGVINAGFNASDLAQFQINSFDTVSVLGGITVWDSTQASTLATIIKNVFGLSSSTLVAMNNLVSGLSPNDIGNITAGDFMDAVPIISGVTTANMTPWFELAQKAYSSDILSPENIVILGSVMGGMNKTQLANLSTDAINSLSPEALLSFSPDTLSVLSATQLSALSRLQAQTIITSPSADSLPTTFTSQLTVRDLASDVNSTTTTTTTTVSTTTKVASGSSTTTVSGATTTTTTVAGATTTTVGGATTTVSGATTTAAGATTTVSGATTTTTTTTTTVTTTTTTKSNTSRQAHTWWILQVTLIISTILTLFNNY